MDYSIKNTTRKQREELVKNALAISISGANPPTKKATEIIREYIDGKKELEDVQKEIIALYKNNS